MIMKRLENWKSSNIYLFEIPIKVYHFCLPATIQSTIRFPTTATNIIDPNNISQNILGPKAIDISSVAFVLALVSLKFNSLEIFIIGF